MQLLILAEMFCLLCGGVAYPLASADVQHYGLIMSQLKYFLSMRMKVYIDVVRFVPSIFVEHFAISACTVKSHWNGFSFFLITFSLVNCVHNDFESTYETGQIYTRCTYGMHETWMVAQETESEHIMSV